jgi:hypothetical protein
MNKSELEAIEKIAIALNAVDQNKLYIIAAVVLVIITSYSVRWYLAYAAKSRSEAALKLLSDTILRHETSSEMKISRVIDILEEISDRQRNIISKSDSIRIVLNKFNDVIKDEVIDIFEWSLVNNNYDTRSDFVRKKIKSAIAGVVGLGRQSLSEFSLSIDLEQFFITYVNPKDKNVHYKLVDQLWEEVEPIYHRDHYEGKRVEDQQVEEMQIAVSNIITAELTKMQMEINNLYR